MAKPCLYHGDFIDLTDETDPNRQKKEVVRVAPPVSAGKNINPVPVVSAQQLNIKSRGGKVITETQDVLIPTNGGDVLLVVDESKDKPITVPMDTEASDIIITPSPSEIRQKKFPIDENNDRVCSDDDDDVIILPNQSENTPKGLKGQMATITPIVSGNKKQLKPTVTKRKVENAARKEYLLKKAKECIQTETQKGLLNKIVGKESTTGPQKESQIVIQSVFTVADSQTAQTVDEDVICLSDEDNSSSKQTPESPAPKGPIVYPSASSDTNKLTQHLLKQIPPDTEKLFSGQKIVPIALDKSKISQSIQDIVETVSAVGAITPGKKNEEDPVYLILYPLESQSSSPTTPKEGQVNKVLALIPKNSKLASKNLKDLQLQNSQKLVLNNPAKTLSDGNQTKPSVSVLKPIHRIKDTEQRKQIAPPSLGERKGRHSYPPGKKVVPPKNISTDNIYQAVRSPGADPLVMPPSQIEDKSLPKKKLAAPRDNFIVPSAPAPRKKLSCTSRIVKFLPGKYKSSPEGVTKKIVNAVRPPSKETDEDVQIEPPCVVTPVDISQIINKRVIPQIEGRCEYQRLQPEESLFKGFTIRQMKKSSCLRELTAILKKETKKVAELKKSMKIRYESNFVACGGNTSYFLPENVVKTEIDDVCDLTEELPTISEVISRVNKEVRQLKESERKRQINEEVSKRDEALQLIKQGLEMMRQWSQAPTQADEVEKKRTERAEEVVPKTVPKKRGRKPKKLDVYIEPPKKRMQKKVQTVQANIAEVEVKKAPQKRKNMGLGKSQTKMVNIGHEIQTKAVETKNVVVKRRRTVKKANIDLNTGNDNDDLLMVKRVDIIKHNKLTTKVRRRN